MILLDIFQNHLDDLFLLFGFLLCSAFFSAAETAFTVLSPAKIELLKEEKKWGWKQIEYITQNLDTCIMSCLIMSNMMNIILSAYLTILATAAFGLGKGVTIAVGIGTASILLFGEIIPKKLAIQYTDKLTQYSAYLLVFFLFILRPITFPISFCINRIWPQKKNKKGEAITVISEDEVRAMVTLGGKSGGIDATSQDFLQKILTLHKKKARDIMIPRNKIVSLPNTSTVSELWKLFEDTHVSRIPIYENDLNDKNIYIAYLPTLVSEGGTSKKAKKVLKKMEFPKIVKVSESVIIQDLLELLK